MTTIVGKILNLANSNPVPGATVSLIAGNVTLKSVAAANDGSFEIATTGIPDSLIVSSVGFTTRRFGLAEFEEFYTFYIEPDYKELDPVIVAARKKKGVLALGVLLLLLYMTNKKR